jgi:hypothetical protein
MAQGHFIQLGFCLSLPYRDLTPSNRCCGSRWKGSLGGGGSRGAPSSLSIGCDLAVWKDELPSTKPSEGSGVSIEFVNHSMSILQSLSSCLN